MVTSTLQNFANPIRMVSVSTSVYKVNVDFRNQFEDKFFQLLGTPYFCLWNYIVRYYNFGIPI